MISALKAVCISVIFSQGIIDCIKGKHIYKPSDFSAIFVTIDMFVYKCSQMLKAF